MGERPEPSMEEMGIKPEEKITPEAKMSKEEKLFQEGQKLKGAYFKELKRLFPDFDENFEQKGESITEWRNSVADRKNGNMIHASISESSFMDVETGKIKPGPRLEVNISWGVLDYKKPYRGMDFVSFTPDNQIFTSSHVFDKLKPWEYGRRDILSDPRRPEAKNKILRGLYLKNPHVVVDRLKKTLSAIESVEPGKEE